MDEFDIWNQLKKKIDSLDFLCNRYPKEGEVWMISVGKNIGFEQNGSGSNFSRPVLVIKKFNNQMFWAVSLSTKQKNFDFYFNYTDPYNQKVSVILAQLKLLSIKRFSRKLYDIEDEILCGIRTKLKLFL